MLKHASDSGVTDLSPHPGAGPAKEDETGAAGRNHAATSGAAATARLSVLLLCDDFKGHANTVLDHIGAFTSYSRHDVRLFNPRLVSDSKLLDLDAFDAVILHYSIFVISENYLSPRFRDKVRRYRGLKVQFIQDEHRRVDQMTDMMRYLGIHVLFTLLPAGEVRKVYSPERLPGVELVHQLAGYVPESLQDVAAPPLEARPIDIGYRGRTLPFWLGRVAQEKAWVGQGILAAAARYGWKCDIGWTERDRIYGDQWTRFMGSCKATLGTESGASITDRDGSIERRTKHYLAAHPDADFEQVFEAVLRPHEGNVRVNAISPRILEAVASRTALILFPGEYSGVIQPWVHYIPLAKDFSNLDEVDARLRDRAFLATMTETAHRDLIASGRYSYRRFMHEVDAVLERRATARGSGRLSRYRLAHLERSLRFGARDVRRVVSIGTRRVIATAKSGDALKRILAIRGGGRIVRRFLGRRDGAPRHGLADLLKDVFRLALVRRGMDGGLKGDRPFSVELRLRVEERQLQFVSTPAPGDALPASSEPGAAPFWRDLESWVNAKQLRSIVWDHSAIGGKVRYPFLPLKEFSTDFGVTDFHRFHAFEELASLLPEEAVRLLASILRSDGRSSPQATLPRGETRRGHGTIPDGERNESRT